MSVIGSQENSVTERDLHEELVGRLFSALGTERESNNPHPDRVAQAAILRKLPPNLVEEIDAHLRAELWWQDFNSNLQHRELRGPEIEHHLLATKLFEMLAVAEDEEIEAPAGNELLALMNNPDRFDKRIGDALRHLRCPDGTELFVSPEGTIVVKGVMEAKYRLSERAVYQLGPGGFRKTLGKVAELLNSMEPPEQEAIGLKEVARRGGKVEVANDYRQVLMLPANCDKRDIDKLLRQGKVRKRGAARLKKLLADSKTVEIRNSAFSTSEIWAMARVLIPMVENHRGKPIQRGKITHSSPVA